MAGGGASEFAAHLADRYRVGRELGRGGSGLVYAAHDLRYDRPVAIKLLRKEFAGSAINARFKREIEILARLDHPNIVALYEWGDFSGAPWYAMSFVDGESLNHRIDREGALPIDESLRIARDVAGALAAAHAAGIIHRDIKPANILIRDGDVLVADFGIARAVNRASLPSISSGGMQIGTPAYMSPEQASAESDVDGRSDIYSLGCVLYEMLAGRSPFSGSSSTTTIAARHVLDPVPPLSTVRASVSKPVEEVVHCALSKSRASRFQTAGEFAAALDAVAREPNVSVVPMPRGSRPLDAGPAAADARRARFIWSGIIVALIVTAVALCPSAGAHSP